jgi:hypothetical protein
VAPHPAASASPGSGGAASTQPTRPSNQSVLRPSADSADQSQISQAEQAAVKSGQPVTVNAMTTATSTTVAQPKGGLAVRESVLPQRVRSGSGWTPVDTTLRRGHDGSLSATALPGDTVTFSGGGTGAAASVSASGTSLGLTWPGSLPAPAVAGASATYRDVLPGVDLVLTATAAQTGGFSEVLVVHDAAAAANPQLRQLQLGISARGTGLLRANRDGSLTAATRTGGYYAAAAPVMWDSSSVAPGTAPAAARARSAAAKQVGAFLAAPGDGPPSSSAAGPAGGARVAKLRTAVTGTAHTLSLAPDTPMLTSASTKFPVYLDPSFSWHPVSGSREAYDPVQESCPTVSHYDTTDTADYWSLGVGYDGFGDCNGINGHANALYVLAVPSQIWGAHLNSATVEAQEAYTASCSASADVTLSLTGLINKNTDWNNRPAAVMTSATTDVGPGPADSCNSTYDTSSSDWKGVSFNVLSTMNDAAAGKWGSFTFRMWEPGDNNDVDWKRFGRSPYLEIYYNTTPSVPVNEKATATNLGAGSVGCQTSSSGAPEIGQTASVHGPYLWASFSDKDGDLVDGTFQYWNASLSSPTYYTLSAGSDLKGQNAAQYLPGSFTSGLANGTLIGWRARATDGTYTSAWSATCYFAVAPTKPDAPTVTSTAAGGDVAVGSQVTVTITQASSSDPATKFVWGLDYQPPTSSPPASQVCSATSATCPLSNGTATLTLTVPSPGPHSVWVYAQDAAGNTSGVTNSDGNLQDTDTFSGAGDPAVSYPSFSAALAAGQPYDNQMISTSASGPGTANDDGDGDAYPYQELASQGWTSGGSVTVDGANFTLPSFSTASTPATSPDNLLAANQTIGMGNGQGNAIVFLATATNAFAGVPSGVGTDAQTGDLGSDDTVPSTPSGTSVAGQDCTLATSADINEQACVPADGTVTYAAGCPVTQNTYTLTVPDWIWGPSDEAAVTTTDWTTPGGSATADAKVYAYAIPIEPDCQVASVTLPDVGASVAAQVSSGISYPVPALHILGMSLRNTSAATPAANGSLTAATSNQAWTPAFTAPAEQAETTLLGSKWGNQTLRIAVSSATSAPAGAQVRIRLSDPDFLAGPDGPTLMIGDATVAQQSAAGSPVPVGTPARLTFGGASSITIPAGGDIYSDPLTLPFAVTAGKAMLISLYLENGAAGTGVPAAVATLPVHSYANGLSEWISPIASSGSGDHASDTTGTPFNGSGTAFNGGTVNMLSGVDVTAPVSASAPDGTPALFVAGDNVTIGSGSVVAPDRGAPSIRVDGQLVADGTAAGYAPVDAGTEAGQVLGDGTPVGGPSLLARIDRDVLSEPDVGTVVINQGLQDLLDAGSSTSVTPALESAYAALTNELAAFGVNVIIADATPCSGFSACTSTVDANRTTLNTDLADSDLATSMPYCVASFDAAVSNGASPEKLASGDDNGDHVNLTAAGFSALATAVTSGSCTLSANEYPLP